MTALYLWFEFIVWHSKLDLVEFIDLPRERSCQEAQTQGVITEEKSVIAEQHWLNFIFSILIAFLSFWICDVLSWFHVSTTTLLVLVIAKVWVLFLRLKKTVKKSVCTYRCHSILMCCDNCKALSSRSRVQMLHMSFSHCSPTIKHWLEKHQWWLLVCSCKCAWVCLSVCVLV